MFESAKGSFQVLPSPILHARNSLKNNTYDIENLAMGCYHA